MSTKEEKPTLAGVNIKTRKRNIQVALDPGSFADAVVTIFEDARKEGDEAGEAWLAAGLPGLQAADLDFNRYGDTLFEVLFAGGRMGAGGAGAAGPGAAAQQATAAAAAAGAATTAAGAGAGLPPLAPPAPAAKAGTKALARFLLGPMTDPTHAGVAPYVAAFQALLRRRPFLVKGLEATLAKLTAGVDFYDADARQRTAVAAARCFAARLGAQSDAVMLPLLNDRAVAKGASLAWATAFFKDFLSTEPADELVALLRKAKLTGRIAELFPQGKRAPADVAAHLAGAGLKPLVDIEERQAADAAVGELGSTLHDMMTADPPHAVADVLEAVTAKARELGVPPQTAVRVLWPAIVATVPTGARSAQQIAAGLAKAVRGYAPLLAAFTTTARAEGALLQAVQAGCYEDPKLLKQFATCVRLLYDTDLVAEDAVRWWATKGAVPKGRHIFVGDLEPFIKWLDEAEEEE